MTLTVKPKEPPRNTDIMSLDINFMKKVKTLINRMYNRGYDAIIFEARRTKQRQEYLYGIGRKYLLNRKPVTWTMKSAHIEGKAVDIISRKKLWDCPEFFDALKEEALKLDLYLINTERCHIQAYKP